MENKRKIKKVKKFSKKKETDKLMELLENYRKSNKFINKEVTKNND